MNRNEKNVNKLTMLGMMTALVFVSNYLRITVGTDEDMKALCAALKEILDEQI